MKILIVSGIFEPESGGPATYAPRLAEGLQKAGHKVTVVTYSDTPRSDSDTAYPFKLARVVRTSRILNRIKMFGFVLRYALRSDCLYFLDWFAAGVPASYAARLLGKKYIVRVGGDYLWEQRYLESDQPPVTLREFYERTLHRRYRFLFAIIRDVLSHATHVVFNSDEQREMYERHYGLTKTSTIYNAMPEVVPSHEPRPSSNEIVFWGRLIVMKNVDSLLRAFARAHTAFSLTIIGDGPRKTELRTLAAELHIENRVTFLDALPYKDVLERVARCRAFILPSWTDISPNQVYECMAIGLPALITKENYLSIRNQLPMTTDPHSIEDIASRLEMLSVDERYEEFANAFKRIHFDHSWADVVREHESLFKQVV